MSLFSIIKGNYHLSEGFSDLLDSANGCKYQWVRWQVLPLQPRKLVPGRQGDLFCANNCNIMVIVGIEMVMDKNTHSQFFSIKK